MKTPLLILILNISSVYTQLLFLTKALVPDLPIYPTTTTSCHDQEYDNFWFCGYDAVNASVCQMAKLTEGFQVVPIESFSFHSEVVNLLFAPDAAFIIGREDSTLTIYQSDRDDLNMVTGTYEIPTTCGYVNSYSIEAIYVICTNQITIMERNWTWTSINLAHDVSATILLPNGTIYLGSSDGIYSFTPSSRSLTMMPISSPTITGSPTFISTIDGSSFLLGNATSLTSIDMHSSQVSSILIPGHRPFLKSIEDFSNGLTYVTGSLPMGNIFKLNSSWKVKSSLINSLPFTRWDGTLLLDVVGGFAMGWGTNENSSYLFSVSLDSCFLSQNCSTCDPLYCGWCDSDKQCEVRRWSNCTMTSCPVPIPLPQTSTTSSTFSSTMPTSTPASTFNLKMSTSASKVPMIAGIASGVGFLIILFVVAMSIFIIRRGKHHPKENENLDIPMRTMTHASVRETERKYDISYQDLNLGEKLGEGNFGTVFKATWRSSPVAVKRLKLQEIDNQLKFDEFLREISLMKDLRPHLNVVSFLGICSAPVCIVTEFCPNGSLLTLLKSDAELTDEISSKILSGVCSGMHHLATEKIVHRDLAARNILLGEGYTAKVADFGLSRTVERDSEYLSTSNIGPIKWMSPESLLRRVYNEKTDVWSFGVLCVEVLTRNDPFPGISSNEVAITFFNLKLADKLRDSVPKVPMHLHQVAMMCLQDDPEMRPTFESLTNAFNGKMQDEIRIGPSADVDPGYTSFISKSSIKGSGPHRNATTTDGRTTYSEISIGPEDPMFDAALPTEHYIDIPKTP